MRNTQRRRNATAALLVCAASLLVLAREPARYGSWSDPVQVANVNSLVGDYFPSLSKDGLSLYFTVTTCPSTGPCLDDGFGGPDIYVSQRATADDDWGAPTNLGPTINTAAIESAPTLSVDGHLLFFASDRAGGFGGNDIYVSRRTHTNDDLGWGEPQNLGSGVNTDRNESSPALFEDEVTSVRILYFDCTRPDGPGPGTTDGVKNGNDICEGRHQPDGTFGPARLVAELNTTSADRAPSVRKDGLELFLTSNRPGFGAMDIWTSTRSSTSSPWSTPVNLGPPINTAANDAGAEISFDGKTLLLQRTPAGATQYDVWLTAREKLK